MFFKYLFMYLVYYVCVVIICLFTATISYMFNNRCGHDRFPEFMNIFAEVRRTAWYGICEHSGFLLSAVLACSGLGDILTLPYHINRSLDILEEK